MIFESESWLVSECNVQGRVSMRLRCYRVVFSKFALIFLLFGLAGLATAAKDAQYYPKANPARHVSLATKLNVQHAPVVFGRTHLEKVAQIIAAKPRPIIRRLPEPELLLIEPVAITVTLQHRSPPPNLP